MEKAVLMLKILVYNEKKRTKEGATDRSLFVFLCWKKNFLKKVFIHTHFQKLFS